MSEQLPLAAPGPSGVRRPLVESLEAQRSQVPRCYGAAAPDGGGAAEGRPGEEEPREGTFSIFPMNLFCCCPGLAELVPGTLQKIQCWTHLVLVVGSCTCVMLLVDTVISFWIMGHKVLIHPAPLLPLIFVPCCLTYFVQTIGQFDDDLVAKRQSIKRAKEDLGGKYEQVVAELECCIARSMDTQASLAERNFESHRRDFLRFLRKAATRFTEARWSSQAAEDSADLQAFRSFLLLWLDVFSECSIDPVSLPLQVATAEQLSCCGAVEAAEHVEERLKVTPVKFISSQRLRDREKLSSVSRAWQKMKSLHKNTMARKARFCKAPEEREEHGPSSLEKAEAGGSGPGHGTAHRWLQLGVHGRCGLDRADAEEDGYPTKLHFGCGSCVLLSAEHVSLMCSLLAGLVLLCTEVLVAVKFSKLYTLEIGVCVLCLAFVLYSFMDIDGVQQLEAQLREVETAQRRVEEQRQSMVDFYDRVQRLSDMWLHRTLPRLEILKQFSEALLDASSSAHAVLLADMCEKLVMLEGGLPSLPLWLSEETMDAATKARIGSMMQELNRMQDVDQILAALPSVSANLAREAPCLTPLGD